ncbi:MAG: amidohydrolase family protein, partial [bacterium]
ERALVADTAIVSFMPPAAREAWARELERRRLRPDAERQLAAYLHNIGVAHRAGVKIAVGTDSNVFPQEIMENLVDAGLTPLDALRAATRNAAEALGVEDRLGSVREGAVADLVVVDGDPVADITHAKRVWGVIKDGRWIDRGDLLARARARFGSGR